MRVVIIGAIATAIAIGAAASGGGGPAPGTANVFVATNGSDIGANCHRYTPAVAFPGGTVCATLAKAYALAFPGDIVEVEAGSYPDSEIDSNAANGKPGASMVTFQAAVGATVTFVNIGLGNGQGTPAPSWITLKNFDTTGAINDIAGLQVFTPAQHIEADNVNGGAFYIRGAQHLVINGGDWGPCDSSGPNVCRDNTKLDGPQVGEQTNADILIENATIHDFSITNVNDHFECMFMAGGDTITVQNNHFYNCEIYDIFLQPNGTVANVNNLTIQNNWFGKTVNGVNPVAGASRQTAVAIGTNNGGLTNTILRYNSFAPGQELVYESGTFTTFTVVGNIFGVSADCAASVTYTYNVWTTSGSCGTGDTSTSPLPYLNTSDGASGDYHLSGADDSSAADRLVPCTSGAALLGLDKEGHARPFDAGLNCDAGSQER